jgi:hypothetical protein
MPQLPRDAVRERAARLREAGGRALARSLASRVGQVSNVLVERDGFGRSEHYAPVKFSGSSLSAPGGREVRRGGENTEHAPPHPDPLPNGAEREKFVVGSVVTMRLLADDAAHLSGIPA